METMVQRFKAVVFDMDGLLLDSEKLALDAFQSTCSRYCLGDLSEVFMDLVGTNSELGKAILKEGLAGRMDHEEFSLDWDKGYKYLLEERPVPLKRGARKLLEKINSSSIPMAVATSTKAENAVKKLGDSGILNYFKLIIGGDQILQSKPDPEIYLKAASQLSLEPYECLALEDSSNGVKSAVAAGMTVVQIPDLVQPNNQLLSLGHIVLNSLSEVAEYDFQSKQV